MHADRQHVGAQLVEHLGCDPVGGAVGAIKSNLEAVEAEVAREGVFHELDVASGRIIEPAGAPERARGRQLSVDRLAQPGFDRRFDLVVQLVAVRAEQLDAVVIERVVRG